MIQIGDKIISLDILEKHFVCDLNSCKGACCVEGDSGAPLDLEEKRKIQDIYKKIKPYMTKEGISEVEKQGVAVYDFEGELTTPLVNNRECAFVFYENGITKCTIEKAYLEGKINYKKPISCHLFPVRIQKFSGFEAVNYEKIKICEPACNCGSKLQIPVYVFLKEPLIRKYGKEWYHELQSTAKLIEKKKTKHQ